MVKHGAKSQRLPTLDKAIIYLQQQLISPEALDIAIELIRSNKVEGASFLGEFVAADHEDSYHDDVPD